MNRIWLVISFGLAAALPAAGAPATHTARSVYQSRNAGQDQTDRFSGRYRVGRDGRVSITNIAGEITVTAGSGDEVVVEAVKRTRGDRSELAAVRIEVDSGPGRVDIRTEHPRRSGGDRVSVDYTVSMPSGASLEVRSISGNVKVTGVRGVVRAETVSGGVTAGSTPRLELAKTISGTVSVSDVTDGETLTLASVSGGVTARSVKAHSLEVSSISGETRLTDITSERLTVKAISGGAEYDGSIVRGGSYDFNVHSGTIRLALSNPAGFVLNANSFSGSIRSELPLTIGGDANNGTVIQRGRRNVFANSHMIHATYGDGSATVTVRTFSGDIVITRR